MTKEIIISNYYKGKQAMQMVIIQTPSGLKNRKNKPGLNSKTVHRKVNKKSN
jgi:hypothetical protein